MALHYDFGQLDTQLDNLESAQATQLNNLSKTGRLLPGLHTYLSAVARRVVATRRGWDLSEHIATVLPRIRRRQAAGKRILAKRSARLSRMQWSLRLAITWGKINRWFKGVRDGWRR